MAWSSYAQSLAGGALIGLAATMLLLLNGRVAGVSGIVGGLIQPFQAIGREWLERAAFVLGLLLAPTVYLVVFGTWPALRVEVPLVVMIVAGLLVGFGTRLGSGCTSGHGVCGLARLSPRSAVAVLTFFLVAMLTVFVMEHVV
jgi:uncharacterized protein